MVLYITFLKRVLYSTQKGDIITIEEPFWEKESQINMKTDSRFAKRSELYCIAENISPEGESIKEHENKLIVNESTARKKITIKKDIIKDCTTIKHYFKEKLLNNI